MRCSQARSLLSPYVDSELDARSTYEIARHLEDCGNCRRIFAAELDWEQSFAAALRAETGDEEALFAGALRGALAGSVRFRPRGVAGRKRWLAVAGAALLFAAVGAGLWAVRPGALPDLLVAAVADHRKHVAGELSPELRSGDPAAVDAFLRRELNVELGPLALGHDWVLHGVRRCWLRGAPVGFVLLGCGGRAVSLYVVSAESAQRFPDALSAAADRSSIDTSSGCAVLERTEGGMRCAIGQVSSARLHGLLADHRTR